MSDWKYVGSAASAKLVALVKAAINKKADKTNATTSAAGLMSAADKAKLDGIADGATKITVDSELSSSSANPVMNGAIAVALSGKADQADVVGKLDKTGGTISGNLKLAKTSEEGTGSIDVDGNISAMSGTTRLWRVYVTNNVDSDQQFKAPLFVLSDPLSQKSVQAKQDGNAAVKIECFDDSISKGYARLKIGTPTEDDDATPKAYVDSKIASGGVTVDAEMSNTSVNPVQNKAIKSALDGKMDKSGGTFTGNVSGRYFTGTWLQTTDASDLGRTPGKIAVLDESGWVYYRTPAELLADIGAMSGDDYYTKAETDAAIAVRAGLEQYGTTKLSTSIKSISKTLAATPYAVKTALDEAKAYADSAVTGTDYVVEQNSNTFWTWRKWNSGIAELWAVSGIDQIAITSAWGSMYYGTWMNLASNVEARKYPFAFITAPSVSATYSGGSSDAWLVSVFKSSDDPLTSAPAYALARPTTATILTPRISYYVSGRYKA